MRTSGLVLFALLSLVVHVTAASFLISGKKEIMIERGVGSAALEVGTLFDRSAQEAVEPEVVEQAKEPPRELPPNEAAQAISVKEFTETPVRHTEVAAIRPDRPVVPLVEELTVNETLSVPDILKPAAISPVEIRQIEEARPLEALPVKKPKITKPVKPKVIKKTRVIKKKKPAKKKIKKAQKAQKANKATRKGGDKANRKGQKKSTGGSGGKNTKADGKALLSNYKGMVNSRIKRQARRIYSRLRTRKRGTPFVTLKIAKSGALLSAHVSRSSGSAKLDKAALRAVRRAAPFPKIPAGTGRSSILYSQPIKLQ